MKKAFLGLVLMVLVVSIALADPPIPSVEVKSDVRASLDNKNEICSLADLNKDKRVSQEDLGILLGYYGRNDCSANNNWCERSDINRDGKVGKYDLDYLLKFYGKQCYEVNKPSSVGAAYTGTTQVVSTKPISVKPTVAVATTPATVANPVPYSNVVTQVTSKQTLVPIPTSKEISDRVYKEKIVASDTIQEDNTVLGGGLICKGDMNRDGQINFADIGSFTAFLKKHNWRRFWFADVNGDWLVDDSDADAFVAVLSGNEKPKCLGRQELLPKFNKRVIYGKADKEQKISGEEQKMQQGIPESKVDTVAVVNNPAIAARDESNPPVTYTTTQSPASRDCKGDMNRDGSINAFDIGSFADFLKRHNWKQFWFADMNGDGFVDERDIDVFVGVLVGTIQPTCR